jgi:hypothetical protein
MASIVLQLWSLLANGCCAKEMPAFSHTPARQAPKGLESERVRIGEPYHG